ncbi:MAG: DUF2293 domain-containing protein [Proteobacteria bacterium]|nr:DUF2293 domain-containing protein [Pseudomonadota bacterium]MBU1708897.1 DUF2293 domain-containing protein [Pseudomonadota bacterium]
MIQKKDKPEELTVFISSRDSICDECGSELGKGAWITLQGADRKAACLSCADLDHLVFLPSGDAALTRRSRKYSRLATVVVKWSRARKRYERQGLLVENESIEQAEKECKADVGQRELRRAQAAVRRAELDEEYLGAFANRVRELFPGCPAGREKFIAEHACRKYSGRVGRSSSAKALDEEAVRLAVVAHIRHQETDYDELLLRGDDRVSAREQVRARIDGVLQRWQAAGS